jgi:hypothetical protein
MLRLQQDYGIRPVLPVKFAHEFEPFGFLFAAFTVFPLARGVAIGAVIEAAISGVNDDVIHGG